MNRYLTIHIPETAVPMHVSRFLHTQAGLTKKQISLPSGPARAWKMRFLPIRAPNTKPPGKHTSLALPPTTGRTTPNRQAWQPPYAHPAQKHFQCLKKTVSASKLIRDWYMSRWKSNMKCNYSEPCEMEENRESCLHEWTVFFHFAWREATSRCSASGIEMGFWIVTFLLCLTLMSPCSAT